jgi:hypothetical protein
VRHPGALGQARAHTLDTRGRGHVARA